MFIQKFYKGISDPNSDLDIQAIFRDGIRSERLRTDPNASLTVLLGELTERALYDHVTDYASVRSSTPFVSLTAGIRGFTDNGGLYTAWNGWNTATSFATRGLKTEGVIFEGWVLVIGIPAWHVVGIAEDLRDHNVYPRFNEFWNQGEVTAKLIVPGIQIKRATRVNSIGIPIKTVINSAGVDPGDMSNVKDVV